MSSTRLCAASPVRRASTPRTPSSVWTRFDVGLNRWWPRRAHGGGARRARAVLRITSGLAESPGESVLHWFVRALGLPAPRLQARIADPELSRFYFPDEVWPEFKVLAEFDGQLKYTSPEELWREKQRHDALVRMGWHTERFIWSDFGDLDALRLRVLTLFPPATARRWRPMADLWK